jgi:peptide-methionine (S)-S-oxide reductase
VTQVQPLDTFHPAEDYHQEYYERNRQEQYCQLVIEPKLDHFQKRYQALLKRAG